MISFSCAHCGLKIKVKEEFAGRSSRCPTCKHTLTVPKPAQPAPALPDDIDTPSSLMQAGLDGGVTLERSSAPAQKSVHELLARRSKKGERYVIEQEIARGGMGAILRGVDCDIRREVAIKYLLDQTDAKRKLRFIEEAQITGQLEHPHIVPIHELAIDGQKRLFFSMKMVRGHSLAQVLESLRRNMKGVEKEYSLGRLLNAFVSICNAMAYAHSRGVVHRDLKPGNIMLGDFGEVYVMDWGLAKVRGRADGQSGPVTNVTTSSNSKVETSRQLEADLTQEGTVLGTPVYMPPEQAAGHLDEIDQRSDVYSLGAILYEMLALTPPVEKDGGYFDVLIRVVKGQILPPEQRSPARARAGHIPRELSAIAMKALAKEPKDRYQTVEDLRRDIERFQEGRSVSAKHDSLREMAWKMVKRNRAISLVTGASLLLVAAVWARSAYVSAHEQRLRREQAVPAFIEAANYAVEQSKFDNALVQISTAVEYDPERADARLLKGQLLIVKGDYPAANRELEQYLLLNPQDAAAAELLNLSRKAQPGSTASLDALAEVLRRQNLVTLAATLVQSRERQLALYRQHINTAWPGLGPLLVMERDGTCTLTVPPVERDKVSDLRPLKGIPLTSLSIGYCKVADLSPLKGAPLAYLNIENCPVRDLTPLHGMPLNYLNVRACKQIQDFTVLGQLPLTQLNLSECSQVQDLSVLTGLSLRSLNLAGCAGIRDLTPLRGMPLQTLNLAGCNLVRDLTVLPSLPLASLDLSGLPLSSLKVLQGMQLTHLNLSRCAQVRDLGPLQGMKLTSLRLAHTRVQDLAPLQNMPLTLLDLQGCGQLRDADLGILKGLKLTSLDLIGCGQIHDLTPLQGLTLTDIALTPRSITRGMEVLRAMPSLKFVAISNSLKDRLSAEQFWKLYGAGEIK